MSIAFVFPGQGSQSVGMLGDLGARPEIRDTFAEASEVLGYDLWALVEQGPEARLNATEQTQPAMLTAGVSVLRAWRAAGGPEPRLAAGHSLGEYAALVCAGSLAFADTVALVRSRGRFMQEAVPAGQGGIAAILGLEDRAVEEVCRRATEARSGELVSPVNYNAPGQVVVAGHGGAVEQAIELAREAGARRAVKLPMSVPVHCALMAPAQARLAAELEAVELRPPAIPVIHNADLTSHAEPGTIRRCLVEQLVSPVRWADTVRGLAALGATTLVEPGPGKVLTGLGRRIDRALPGLAVHDAASLDSAVATMLEGA